MDNPQNNATPGSLHIRGFQGISDFDSIAHIYNTSSTRSSTPVTAEMMKNLVLTSTLCIAAVDNTPVSFIFVIKEGSMQLDEYGTSEKTWLFTGPTSLPNYEKTDSEKNLLHQLLQNAREKGISTLYRFIKTTSQPHISQLLEHEGFYESKRYYHMKLEMAEPPHPRVLPDGLELIDYNNFDTVWKVLEAAFDYKEKDNTYKRMKHILKSLESSTLLCIETTSQQPVGTIVAAKMGTTGIIATFGVVPSFQRQGIGSHLMGKALDYFWQSGIKTVELSVRVNNQKALKIYQDFMFQIVPERTIIVFKKEL
jgi:ribosomal protein S18 acetylase RimI-like enzyme